MVNTGTGSIKRVVLKNISWQIFETMLADMGEDRSSRLTYDHDTLEIMTPLLPHEHWNKLIERLIFVLAEELNLEVFPAGSTTLKREDLQRGAEPDSSYYIQNEALVRNKTEIDFNSDSPPDLIVEVDVISLYCGGCNTKMKKPLQLPIIDGRNRLSFGCAKKS